MTVGIIRRLLGPQQHTVLLYDSFGARGRALIHGRVLAADDIPAARPEHSRWKNAVALLRRAAAAPLPHARIRVRMGTATQEFHADDEGFFAGWMGADDAERLDPEWVRVRGELVAPRQAAPATGSGRVLMPVERPEFIVISDVDDTVLQSNVTSLLVALRTMLFQNARTRLPFPGVAAFYQALRRGASGAARNPTFYVSSSPWNLYDVIEEFLRVQSIPAGPLMLRDLDLGARVFSSRQHHTHKREMIRRVLETFDDPVILLGDSGQQDPEIYRDAVHDYAGRIRAVYIRNVTSEGSRSRAIQALAEEVVAAGSSLVLADDTLAAARHAAEHGFIADDALDGIAAETRADEGRAPGKSPAPGSRGPTDEAPPSITIE